LLSKSLFAPALETRYLLTSAKDLGLSLVLLAVLAYKAPREEEQKSGLVEDLWAIDA
jgi:hypothetical protein